MIQLKNDPRAPRLKSATFHLRPHGTKSTNGNLLPHFFFDVCLEYVERVNNPSRRARERSREPKRPFFCLPRLPPSPNRRLKREKAEQTSPQNPQSRSPSGENWPLGFYWTVSFVTSSPAVCRQAFSSRLANGLPTRLGPLDFGVRRSSLHVFIHMRWPTAERDRAANQALYRVQYELKRSKFVGVPASF